ncbi:unnamed protein product [Closterium sp. NIES-65]|nr:unnamed protein product [Closterium sp. NIES-65]
MGRPHCLLVAALILVLATLPDSASGNLQQPNVLKRFVTTWRQWHGAVTSRSSTSTLLQNRRYLSTDPAEAADVARVLRRHGGWWHDADGQAYVSTSGDEGIQEVTDDVAEGIVSRRRRKLAAAGNTTGPCTPLADAILITVTTEEDIAKRTQYPNKQTVILELANDITLSKGLVFGAAYRCTIFRSSAAKANYKIAYMGDTQPLLLIANTSNVIILRINFWMGVTMRSPECTDFLYTDLGSGNTCPTIMLWRVHNTQVAKGSFYGRIDVLRAMSSRVDSMKGTGLPLFVKSPGVIRVSFSGRGSANHSSEWRSRGDGQKKLHPRLLIRWNSERYNRRDYEGDAEYAWLGGVLHAHKQQLPHTLWDVLGANAAKILQFTRDIEGVPMVSYRMQGEGNQRVSMQHRQTRDLVRTKDRLL